MTGLFPRIFCTIVVSLGASFASAEADPGSYLAARHAGQINDYEAAAEFYAQALQGDPNNPQLLENALVSNLGIGDFDQAYTIALAMRGAGLTSQIGNLVVFTNAFLNESYDELFSSLEAGQGVGALVDGLSQGWAHVGQGKMALALSTFDELAASQGMRSFGLYHKALALASVGDFESAEAILAEGAATGMPRTRRSILIRAQILSQLDRNADAITLIDVVFGERLDPNAKIMRARLAAGEPVPFDMVITPAQGMGEALFAIAGALQGETNETYVLLYTRLTSTLNPDHVGALLLSGMVLENLERYDLANAVYLQVPSTSPDFYAAELSRADALRKADQIDTAIEVLRQLSRSNPDLPLVHSKLADLLRYTDEDRDAITSYSRAIDLYGTDNPLAWRSLFGRGITFYKLDDWPPAEQDFRAALALNPNQPQVLNYLGYSLVERQEKLGEALEMIETAVLAQPSNGAITDSLGWVLFSLGRYEEAVLHMERAASLSPVDPVINDHLGDSLWAVGRVLEARFQWQRALSFAPEETDALRIRRKLDVGLDDVLAEEGADPIHVASDQASE